MCRKQIPHDAIICTECDSYQDWRRYFGVSGTILSLLVALISVLTVAVPVIRSGLTPERSVVHCDVLRWNREAGTVAVVVSNSGTRPAAVQTLSLTSNASHTANPKVVFRADFPEPILEPGKYRVLSFQALNQSVPTKLDPVSLLQPENQLNLIVFPFAREQSCIPCENWGTFHE